MINFYFELLSIAKSYFFLIDNFQDTFVNFLLNIFTQVLIKELARTLTHVGKILNCSVFQNVVVNVPRNSWEGTKLSLKNFVNVTFKKTPLTVAEFTLIQEKKMITHNIMACSYHSKIRSSQNMGVPHFSCLGNRV